MISLLHTHITDLHVCSVETLACSSDETGRFVCGLYELDEAAGNRNGGIVIGTWNHNIHTAVFSQVCKCDGGVLDMKVCCNLIAAALATGQLVIYNFDGSDTLQVVCNIIDEEEGLFLSVDWSNKVCAAFPLRVAVSTQKGSIIVYEFQRSQNLVEIVRMPNVHKMFGEVIPAWIVAFDPHSQGSRLISGGDDCVLRLWSIITTTVNDDSDNQTANDNNTNAEHLNYVCDAHLQQAVTKQHDSGVTSAQWHPHNPRYFATGSYDEHIRIWDDQSLVRPVLSLHAGGGVWRVKWVCPGETQPPRSTESSDDIQSSSSVTYILASCMHGGSAIFQIEETITISDNEQCNSTRWTCLNVLRHTDPETPAHLAYGIGLLRVLNTCRPAMNEKHEDNEIIKTFTVVSCSFYDNRVFVWLGNMAT